MLQTTSGRSRKFFDASVQASVIFGFNTDIRVGDVVYHVQTEDRGPANPTIDTTVYARGRVVRRIASSYREQQQTENFSADFVQTLLEQQHRQVISGLRDGTLQGVETQAKQGIRVQLMNPGTCLAGGSARLELGVQAGAPPEPVAGAQVRVTFESISGPVTFSAATDAEGRAEISFPMPRLGPGGTDLIIQAAGAAGEDEIRYSLRPKPKPKQTVGA